MNPEGLYPNGVKGIIFRDSKAVWISSKEMIFIARFNHRDVYSLVQKTQPQQQEISRRLGWLGCSRV